MAGSPSLFTHLELQGSYLRADQGRVGAPGPGMCIPLQNDWKRLDSELGEGKRRCGHGEVQLAIIPLKCDGDRDPCSDDTLAWRS